MTAAPVGPLVGATRVLPDGWLTHPLTTDPHRAEIQARALLTNYHRQRLCGEAVAGTP